MWISPIWRLFMGRRRKSSGSVAAINQPAQSNNGCAIMPVRSLLSSKTTRQPAGKSTNRVSLKRWSVLGGETDLDRLNRLANRLWLTNVLGYYLEHAGNVHTNTTGF